MSAASAIETASRAAGGHGWYRSLMALTATPSSLGDDGSAGGSGDGATVPISFSQQMLASCSGALVTSFLVTPFDVVKNRLQAQEHAMRPCPRAAAAGSELFGHLCPCVDSGYDLTASRSSAGAQSARFEGTLDAFLKIRHAEGASSLWRGLWPSLIMNVPATVIYFSAYDSLKEKYGANRPEAPMVSGGLARLAAATVISPLEMVRTKLQAGASSNYSDLWTSVRGAVRSEGTASLWRGLVPTLLRDVPFSVVYWTGYEVLKSMLTPDGQTVVPTSSAFIAGALAGSFAAVITTPFDVIKTQQQAQLGEYSLPAGCPEHGNVEGAGRNSQSMRDIGRDVHQRQGWRGFFVGTAPRVLKVAPACAIMICSYEFFKAYFRTLNSQERAVRASLSSTMEADVSAR